MDRATARQPVQPAGRTARKMASPTRPDPTRDIFGISPNSPKIFNISPISPSPQKLNICQNISWINLKILKKSRIFQIHPPNSIFLDLQDFFCKMYATSKAKTRLQTKSLQTLEILSPNWPKFFHGLARSARVKIWLTRPDPG